MSDTEKAADKKAEAEKAAKEAADKKAAEQEKAQQEEQRRAAEELEKQPIYVVGIPGGVFAIDGPGLGSSGTLKIGGQQVQTTRWGDNSVRGILPVGVKGTVELDYGGGKRFGVYPSKPPSVVKTTTTTVEYENRPGGQTDQPPAGPKAAPPPGPSATAAPAAATVPVK